MARSVRFFRRELGISQAQMARVMHVSLDAIKHWETARRNPDKMHDAFMQRILDVWRCPPIKRAPDQFIGELLSKKTVYDSLLFVFSIDVNRP